MKKIIVVMVAAALLAGCTSQAERLAKCEAQGISRDACYLADQNRQSAINAAAEKQALENAVNAVQHAQAAKFPTYTYKDLTLQIKDAGIYVDGKPGIITERNDKAVVYSQGLYSYIVYSSGKVAIMKDGVFIDFMKKIK